MHTVTFVPKIEKRLIETEILVDNEPIGLGKVNYIVPSIGAIRASLENLGRYECPIYTCSCGVAECADIRMEVLASSDTIVWKMRNPAKFFFIFDYEQYADAYEAYQKGLRYLIDVQRLRVDNNPEFVKWILEPL
jgi:hypothetical protein